MNKQQRPEGITDEHLIYLDKLRESGDTNMWGAGRYVEEEFDLNRDTAKKILLYWIKTFGDPQR